MISKVKTIAEIKPRWEWEKKVFYHNCYLEDWQKISIGKKNEWDVKVWDEIEYEQVDDWKWGKKNQVMKKPFVKPWFQKQKPNNAWFALAYAKDIWVAYIWQKQNVEVNEILKMADLFYNWMQSHE